MWYERAIANTLYILAQVRAYFRAKGRQYIYSGGDGTPVPKTIYTGSTIVLYMAKISDAKYRELLVTLRKDQIRRLAAIGDESPYLRGARVSFQESIAQIDAILEMI